MLKNSRFLSLYYFNMFVEVCKDYILGFSSDTTSVVGYSRIDDNNRHLYPFLFHMNATIGESQIHDPFRTLNDSISFESCSSSAVSIDF